MTSPNPPLPQAAPSSYTWGQLFDFTRRQGAASVNASPDDSLLICRAVSAQSLHRLPVAIHPSHHQSQPYPGHPRS